MIPLTNEENKSYCHLCRKIKKKKRKKKRVLMIMIKTNIKSEITAITPYNIQVLLIMFTI